MAAGTPGLLQLSNELLRDILDHIEADPDKLVNLDRRAYLSQESFKPPAFPTQSQAHDIASFRLACHRLSEVGAIHQFARVTTRFSKAGFRRLEAIASQPSIAKHVKKFSYVVPYFYAEGRDKTKERLLRLKGSLGSVDVRHYIRKADEQHAIVQTKQDARALERALAAFISLQHVQILRVQDYEDSVLLNLIRQGQHAQRRIELSWAPACSHSTKTLATALLSSGSPCSRFSSPMLSTQSAIHLAAHPPQMLATLSSRLTSLELHFDDPTDLDLRMTELSGVFRTIFASAANMQAVHVGFPSHRPLNLRLEEVFHHVKWEKLAAFGIQAWKLEAREIIGLVRRHRDRLRGLRLRDVFLKEGSMWKDVLQVVRDEMQRLDWVSLRRIGYAKRFEEQWASGGIEIEDVPGGDSESGDEDDDDRFSPAESVNGFGGGGDDSTRSDTEESDDGDEEDEDEDNEGDEDDDDENGPAAHEIGFPQLTLQQQQQQQGGAGRCDCAGRAPQSADELGDDGVWVSNVQRKTWERWCISAGCIHSAGAQVQQQQQQQAVATRGGGGGAFIIPAMVAESP